MQGESTGAVTAAAGRMPGIVEVTTPATPGSSLKTPSTPRIDISRASSSSHHEDSNSRDSSPERELLAGNQFANYLIQSPFFRLETLFMLYKYTVKFYYRLFIQITLDENNLINKS